MTIGASNTTGYARFLGTCIGALCSILVWSIAGSNAFGLAFLGFVMAICTFYISLLKGQGPLGRFIMLTYNLSVLYSFSLSQSSADEDPDERSGNNPDITKITLHRVAAVLLGCIWGIIVTRGVWPIRARKKLKSTLKLVWLRLGRIWESDPLARRITNPGVAALYMTPEDRRTMQSLLSDLETLRVAARYEIELNAPFPDTAYGKIIQHTQSIVDDLHALDLQLQGIPPSEQQLSLLRYTSRERQNLAGQISHLLGGKFSLWSSGRCSGRGSINTEFQPSLHQSHMHVRRTMSTFPKRSIHGTGSWPLFSCIAVGMKPLPRRWRRLTASCMAMVSSRAAHLPSIVLLTWALVLVIDQIIGKMAEILVNVRRLSTGVEQDVVN